MTDKLTLEILRRIREAREKARGYSDFFQWPDRDREELGVVQELIETMSKSGGNFLRNIAPRGRGFDPPDCEGTTLEGLRAAVELTELVDQRALEAAINSRRHGFLDRSDLHLVGADWSEHKFELEVSSRLKRKHDRFEDLKGGPYPGGYFVILYTDEPNLPKETVNHFSSKLVFSNVHSISRAFVVLSYDPEIEEYPVIELRLAK